MKFFIIIISFLVITKNSNSNLIPSAFKENLLKKYQQNYNQKNQILELKSETLKHGSESVEVLIEVMKNGKYPDKNRWVATFMLGQIMGDKSAPFLVKFFNHPNWIMRMASLKTMLALKQENYGPHYSKLLSDDSFIVRSQALENIRLLKITNAAPQVWGMLYDKRNYYQAEHKGKILSSKRSNIIKSVISTIGDLKFEKAKDPLIKMILKDKYIDIFPEMDLALSKITGRNSPNESLAKKRLFWQKMGLNQTIL